MTEVLLARLRRPDFLARVDFADDEADSERVDLLETIRRYQEYLEQVLQRASEDMDFSFLFDHENRIKPLITAAQQKPEALAATDPIIMSFANTENV